MAGTFVRGTTRLAVVLTSLVLPGCNETVAPDVPFGEFDVEITGDATRSGGGVATQGVSLAGGDPVWVLNLVTPGEVAVYVFFARYGGRPEPGEYAFLDATDVETFEDGDWSASVTIIDGESPVYIGFSTGGTVEVVLSSEGQVAGIFDFDAVGFVPGAPDVELSISVTGSFNAGPGAIFFPD